MGVPTLPEISCSQEPPLLPCTCICVHGCVQNHTPTCKDFPAHTPVHSHTRVCTPLHSPMCALHPWASKSVQNQKALCKDLDALSRVHAYSIHTHVYAHHCTALCAHSIHGQAKVCKTKRPCAKTLMHSPVFMHTYTCVHSIPLHTHVHDNTSAAPALHTAMCMHTDAKLAPASTVHTAKRNARSDVQHHLCTPPYARIPALTARGHTCVHSIPLHTHVHDNTSAAPALHTAMCMHTDAKLAPASTVHTAKRNARSDVQHHLCTPPYARIPALTARGQNAAGTAQPTRRRWAMSGGKAPPYAHSFSSLE